MVASQSLFITVKWGLFKWSIIQLPSRFNHLTWCLLKYTHNPHLWNGFNCAKNAWNNFHLVRDYVSHYRLTIDRMVQSLFHKIGRKHLTTWSWLHLATFYFHLIDLNSGNKQSQTELENRLNGIFTDAPGFQKSTVISSNAIDEKFSADVLERIQSLTYIQFSIWVLL